MRGLAQYAMVGRRQAIIVVLLCGFFPLLYFISASMVGLVNLRKSSNEGLIILLWSLLPAGLLWALGDTSPLVLMISVAALSQLLKRDHSWQFVILLCVVLGVFIQLSLPWQTVYVEQAEIIVSQIFAVQANQATELAYTADQLLDLLLGFYGATHAVIIILCLMLARWWQAALYKPGGFQLEFHQLRFDPKAMLLVLGFIIVGLLGIKPFDSWLMIFCIPPTLGGIALMHYAVKQKKMGSGWLVLCYITSFLMSPIVIMLGLLDSVMNLRKYIKD
jgi:hypothetical protein